MDNTRYSKMVEDLRRYFIQDPFPWGPEIIALSGENDTLRIFDGKRETSVIDANSGCWGPKSIGYSNPQFLEALSRQAKKLLHTVFASEEIIEFAKELTSITPRGLNRVIQVTCASHANEAALRLCCEATGKWGVVTPKQGFHGTEMNVVGLTSLVWPHWGIHYPVYPHAAIMPNCYCYRCYFDLEYPSCNYRCAYALEDAIQYGSPYPPGALIMEPIQQGTFNFPPSNEYFQILGRICKANDMYFILDEAHYGGAGRLGEWFAAQLFDIPVDAIAAGKGIGNGFPIGITVTKDELVERAAIYSENEKECKKVIYTTHQFDPLVAAAGIAVIKYIRENNILARTKRLGKYLLEELKKVQEESKIVGRVDGRGLYVGVELVKDKETKERFSEAGKKFNDLALEKGVFFPPVRGTGVIGIRPPLTIEERNVDKIINVFGDCVKEIERTMLK